MKDASTHLMFSALISMTKKRLRKRKLSGFERNELLMNLEMLESLKTSYGKTILPECQL